MDRVTVLLFDEVLDRRAFDLYNLYHSKGQKYLFAFSEKSLAQRILYPGSITYENTTEGLLNLVSEHPSKTFVFIPLLEESVVEFYSREPLLQGKLLNLLPTPIQFDLLRDKVKLTQWADQWNCAPKLFSYESLCLEETWTNGLKVMAKPSHGRGSRGLKVLNNCADALMFEPKESYVYQAFVGDGKSVFGVCVLAKQGAIVDSYQHQRIRTYPESGGVSTYAALCREEKLDTLVSSMISDLNGSGLLMFEFLRDDEGQWRLLECNPRLWGTVALGESAGHSLLEKYIALCTGQPLKQNEIQREYSIRWMFPYEYLWIAKGGLSRLGMLRKKSNEWHIGMTGAGLRFCWYVLYSLLDQKKWKTFWRKLRQS
ncbi:MAG: hypothetical protein RL059_1320 [Bacteroidota bacterium]